MGATDDSGACRRRWQWTTVLNKVDRYHERGLGRLERRGLVSVYATVPGASNSLSLGANHRNPLFGRFDYRARHMLRTVGTDAAGTRSARSGRLALGADLPASDGACAVNSLGAVDGLAMARGEGDQGLLAAAAADAVCIGPACIP